jgi:hypothetical protein
MKRKSFSHVRGGKKGLEEEERRQARASDWWQSRKH